MHIERHNVDENFFYVSVDGVMKYSCVRETVKDPKTGENRRGYWLLTMPVEGKVAILERNQYSNDILEMVRIHEEGRPIFFTKRVRFQCPSREEYDATIDEHLVWAGRNLEGEWYGLYQDWDHMLVLEKD